MPAAALRLIGYRWRRPLLALAAVNAHGEAGTLPPVPQAAPQAEYSLEGLNLVGAAVTMPLISDTILGEESGFRRALFRRGLLLRVNALPRVSVNLLDGSVPPEQQAYIGHRPTWITGLHPILTADLRQLGLRHAQLNISGAWRWTTWNPAGPKTVSLASLYLYKMWRDRQIEIKAGYLTNDIEFVGMQVGGSLATAAQGVYAVLPFQVGMSYFPLTAPAFNLRLRGPRSTYVKIGAQRSLDAEGGIAAQARNRTGFRFAPKGNGLLLIQEAGYQRPSSARARNAWFRAGYLHNDTRYTNRITGRKETGNYCAYALMDYQLTQSGAFAHGLYVGATVMAAPEKFNAYHRYYEARLYQRAPFRQRPDDLVSVVAAYRGHSKYVTDALSAQGKTVWRSSPSLTASYALHLSPGAYLTVGLGYVRGAAIAPRVRDTLIFTTNWGFYF